MVTDIKNMESYDIVPMNIWIEMWWCGQKGENNKLWVISGFPHFLSLFPSFDECLDLFHLPLLALPFAFFPSVSQCFGGFLLLCCFLDFAFTCLSASLVLPSSTPLCFFFFFFVLFLIEQISLHCTSSASESPSGSYPCHQTWQQLSEIVW